MALNNGGHAFRRMRRYLQGRGVEYRRAANVTGAAASTNIPVAGMKSGDELISVTLWSGAAAFVTQEELLTETGTAAVQASVTPAQANPDNLVKWVAMTPNWTGVKGNDLQIEILNNGNSKPLVVDVIAGTAGAETKVSIQAATDGSGTILSTANQVIDAVAAHPQAKEMMEGQSAEGTGDGAVVAYSAASFTGGVDAQPANVIKVVTAPVQASFTTSLTGSNNDIVWVAQSPNFIGTLGNALKIEYLDPAAANKSLAVSVKPASGTLNPPVLVSVSLATDGSSTIISTAQQIADAVAAHPQAKEMMIGKTTDGTGDGAVTAMSVQSLASGADEVVNIKTATQTNVNAGDRLMVDWLTIAR